MEKLLQVYGKAIVTLEDIYRANLMYNDELLRKTEGTGLDGTELRNNHINHLKWLYDHFSETTKKRIPAPPELVECTPYEDYLKCDEFFE